LETHRHRHKDFTGSQERISKMASVGGEAEVAGVLVASAAMVAEPRSWRRRLGTGGGNGGGGSDAMAAHWGAQPGIDPRGRTFSIFRLDRSELVKAFAMYVRRQIDFRWHLPWSYHLLYWNLESHTDRWLPNRPEEPLNRFVLDLLLLDFYMEKDCSTGDCNELLPLYQFIIAIPHLKKKFTMKLINKI
jgi:hypothetical protein